MKLNTGDNRKLFLKLKSELRLYHVVLATPKTFPEKLTLTVVEMQQLPHIEQKRFQRKKFLPEGTIQIGRRKICVNFKTDIHELNFLMYR